MLRQVDTTKSTGYLKISVIKYEKVKHSRRLKVTKLKRIEYEIISAIKEKSNYMYQIQLQTHIGTEFFKIK